MCLWRPAFLCPGHSVDKGATVGHHSSANDIWHTYRWNLHSVAGDMWRTGWSMFGVWEFTNESVSQLLVEYIHWSLYNLILTPSVGTCGCWPWRANCVRWHFSSLLGGFTYPRRKCHQPRTTMRRTTPTTLPRLAQSRVWWWRHQQVKPAEPSVRCWGCYINIRQNRPTHLLPPPANHCHFCFVIQQKPPPFCITYRHRPSHCGSSRNSWFHSSKSLAGK